MRHRSYWNEADSEAAVAFKQKLAEILAERRLTVKEAAARLNITSERLYKYLNEAAGNNNLPAYLLPIFTKMIGPDLLLYLAHEAGYTVARLPEETPTLKDALCAATTAMRECSGALEAFSKAVEDGKVTPEEMDRVRKEVREALSALFTLQAIAEGMRG